MLTTSLLIIHIIGGSILFGGGILTCIYCCYGFFHPNTDIRKKILKTALKMNLAMIAPSGIIQIITGLTLIYLNAANYNFSFILQTIIAFGLASFSWLIGLQLLSTCYHRIDHNLNRFFISWVILSIFAMCNIIALIFIMSTHAH